MQEKVRFWKNTKKSVKTFSFFPKYIEGNKKNYGICMHSGIAELHILDLLIADCRLRISD